MSRQHVLTVGQKSAVATARETLLLRRQCLNCPQNDNTAGRSSFASVLDYTRMRSALTGKCHFVTYFDFSIFHVYCILDMISKANKSS
jgi:hypothetical protein